VSCHVRSCVVTIRCPCVCCTWARVRQCGTDFEGGRTGLARFGSVQAGSRRVIRAPHLGGGRHLGTRLCLRAAPARHCSAPLPACISLLRARARPARSQRGRSCSSRAETETVLPSVAGLAALRVTGFGSRGDAASPSTRLGAWADVADAGAMPRATRSAAACCACSTTAARCSTRHRPAQPSRCRRRAKKACCSSHAPWLTPPRRRAPCCWSATPPSPPSWRHPCPAALRMQRMMRRSLPSALRCVRGRNPPCSAQLPQRRCATAGPPHRRACSPRCARR